MDSNTHSTSQPPSLPDEQPQRLAALAPAIDELAAHDLDQLPDAALADQVLALRRLLDRLEGHWLQQLAAVDSRGAAGAEDGLAVGTRALPDHVTAEAEPVLVEAARQLDPGRLRRLVGHLVQVADPEGADAAAQRRHERRGLWLTPTLDHMVAVDGLLEPEAGQIVLAALEPLARPADAGDTRSGSQRTADALCELARRSLEGGGLPVTGGVRPQLLVTVDLDSLLGHPGAVGGDLSGVGPLDPGACRRLACDGTVTRVLVSRDPSGQPHPADGADGAAQDPCCDPNLQHPAAQHP